MHAEMGRAERSERHRRIKRFTRSLSLGNEGVSFLSIILVIFTALFTVVDGLFYS